MNTWDKSKSGEKVWDRIIICRVSISLAAILGCSIDRSETHSKNLGPSDVWRQG